MAQCAKRAVSAARSGDPHNMLRERVAQGLTQPTASLRLRHRRQSSRLRVVPLACASQMPLALLAIELDTGAEQAPA